MVFFLIMGIWHMIKVCETWVSMCMWRPVSLSTADMRMNQVVNLVAQSPVLRLFRASSSHCQTGQHCVSEVLKESRMFKKNTEN